MKRILLKEVEADDGSDFEYRRVLIDILRVQPKGMDLAEMETALAGIGKIKRGAEYADLEDAEYQYLLGRITEYRWRIADGAILRFVKDMREAQPPPIEE